MKRVITALLSLILLWPSLLLALPKGGNVVQGSATISEQGEQLLITQGSQNVQINFESFNIAETEQVQFIQPGSDAIAVNLVTGEQMSQLMGQLNANGQVFLINQNGIMVGNGAQVDVAGLLLSSQALSEQDIALGQFVFTDNKQEQALISNQGQINARYYVALISPVIDNAGHIEVSNGDINLLSSGKVNVQLSPLTGLNISTEQAIEQGMISNSGSLHTQGGKVLLSANSMGRLHQTVINNSGEIRATSLIADKGEIILSSASEGVIINSGLLDVNNTGNNGGKIQVSGSKIANLGTMTANTQNGNAGNINILASDSIVLASNSHISASSVNKGNGGKIDIIAQNNTRFMHGAKIQANAGSESGDGGKVEVSGYQQVEISGLVETKSKSGSNGELLIDPFNVTISNTDANGSFDANDPNIFTPSSTGSAIDVNTLENNLKSSNVTITTTGGGSESGDISLSVDINLDGTDGNTLALIADGSIQVNGNINDLTSSSIDNTNIEMTAGGNIDITVGKLINANAGKISLTAGGNANITGLVSSNADQNAIQIDLGGTLNQTSVSGLDALAPNGGLVVNTGAGINSLNVNVNQLSGSNSSNSDVTINNASDLAISNYTTLGSMVLSIEGELQLSSSGLVVANTLELNSLDISDSDPNVSLSASDLILNLNTTKIDTSLNFDVDRLQVEHRGGNNLTLIDSDGVSLEFIKGLSAYDSDGGNFSLTTSTGDLIINSAINLNQMDSNNFRLNSANNLTVNANISDQNAGLDNVNIALNATNEINISDGTQINAGAGTLSLTSGGNMNITGLTSRNTVTLNSGGQINDNGDILLDIDAATSLAQLISAAGINDLELDVQALEASNANNSTITISDNNDLIINNISTLGELNINTAGNLNLADNGSINTNDGGDINLNSGGAMQLGSNSTLLANSNIKLQSNQALTVDNTGLSSSASIQIQATSLQDSDSEIDISAQALLLTLSAQNSDLVLNTQVSQLDVTLVGKASLAINQNSDLSLLDLNNDGNAINISQGNLILQLASGNLNINNIVQANDQLADGLREGMIHLQLSGDLALGDNAVTQLLALNNVDQSATGGLTGSNSSTALYIQQLDVSETDHLFNFDNANAVEIRSQGGDIVINNRSQSLTAQRNINLGSQTTIQAYNQVNDPSSGNVIISSGVVDSGATVTALSQRQISLIAGPEAVDDTVVKKIVVDEVVVEASQEKIKAEPGGEIEPTAQQSDTNYLLHAWFGDCIDKDGWANSCSNFTALEYFLKRLLIGGALPK